jgi:hypothetical protein
MNVGDQTFGGVYRFDLTDKVIGMTNAPPPYTLFGGTLLAEAAKRIDVYACPAGGTPKRSIEEPFDELSGMALSYAVTMTAQRRSHKTDGVICMFPKNSLYCIVAIVGLAISCGCSTANQTMPSLNPGITTAAAAAPAKSSRKIVMLVSESGTNDVLMLAYPSGKLLKTLTGSFSEPQGICGDGLGHFWITNTGDSNVLEYSIDGTMLSTLLDPDNYPVGCAYDPKTGDLAVTNIVTTSDGPGNVAIYTKAKGSPKIYTGGSLQRVYFGAYDGNTGTLVVDGENSSYSVAIASFADGKFRSITLKGATIEFPGGLAWAAKDHSINVGDQDGGKIYQITLTGKVTGTTTLNSSDVVSYAIFGGKLLAPGTQGIGVYAYPAGGNPKRIIDPNTFSEPIGIAVSSAVTE